MGNIFGDIVILKLDQVTLQVPIDDYHTPIIATHNTDADMQHDIKSLHTRSESEKGDAEASATLAVIFALGMFRRDGDGRRHMVKHDVKLSRYYTKDRVFMTSIPKPVMIQRMLDLAEKACEYREKLQ